MNKDTGEMRDLQENEEPRFNESVFKVGDTFELKGCSFKIMYIKASDNRMTIQGIPKNWR